MADPTEKTPKIRLTLVVEYDDLENLLEGSRRAKDAANEYGEVVSATVEVPPGTYDLKD